MMKLPFYEILSDRERRQIGELADILEKDAFAFAAPFAQGLRPSAISGVAEIIAAAVPWGSPERLMQSTRFCVWVCFFDLLCDEAPDATISSIEALQARVETALGQEYQPNANDLLVSSLAASCHALARNPAGEALMPLFTRTFRRELEANTRIFSMAKATRAGMQLPEAEEYLSEATYSIYQMSCSLSLLLAVGEPELANHVEPLEQALFEAAAAIRLANDLATRNKDLAEGGLNILSLGWSTERATQNALGHMEAFRSFLDHALASGAPPRTIKALSNLTELSAQMYGYGYTLTY